VQERWQGISPLLSSFSADALQAAWRVAPDLQYGLLFEAVPADWQRQRDTIGAVTLHCAADQVTDAVLAEAAVAGVPVLCYTVNEIGSAQALFARGVGSVFSDRIDLLA